MLQTEMKCQDWHGSQPCAGRPGSCFTISFPFFVGLLEGSGDTSSIFIYAANKNEQHDDNNPDFFVCYSPFCIQQYHISSLASPSWLFPSCWNGMEKESRERERWRRGKKKRIREIEICCPKPTAATLFYGGVMFVVFTLKESIWPQQRLLLTVLTKCPQRPQCSE